jgi:hypothetical protein
MASPARHALALALVAALGAGAGAALLPDDDERPRRAPAPRTDGPARPLLASLRPPALDTREAHPASPAPVASRQAPAAEEVLEDLEQPLDPFEPPLVDAPAAPPVDCGPTQAPSLVWLARHQGVDGGWSCAGFSARCPGRRCSGGGATVSDATATGLSILAFLGAGYTHLTRSTYVDRITKQRVSLGKTVKTGLEWLLARQGRDGRLDPDPVGHAIAALALAEAYGLTNAVAYKAPAQRAVDHLTTRRQGLGWRVEDPFVSVWAVMALKSAYIAGLEVPRLAFDLSREWLDRATDPAGTLLGDPALVRRSGARQHPTTAAIGLLLRIHLDSNQRDPRLAPPAKLLVGDLPRRDEVDSFHWYFATLALFQSQGGGAPFPSKDGAGPSSWEQWQEALKAAVLPAQRLPQDGCADGSWDPEVDRWGHDAGRVCVTALNTMSLELYYRSVYVFGK